MAKPHRDKTESANPFGRELVWAVRIFAVNFILYYFYSDSIRQIALLHIFSPDQILLTWMGNDASRFGVLDRIPIFTVAFLICLVAHAVGRLLLLWTGADSGLNRLEKFLFAIGAGLNTISLYTLAVGLCGGLRQRYLFVVPAVAALAVAGWYWRRPSDEVSPRVFFDSDQTLLGRYGLWLAVPFIVVMLLGGVLPPWEFDVREYHLQVPKEWYERGQVDFLPYNVYAQMPLGSEMHAIVGMVTLQGMLDWWWGALTGKLIIAAYAPLTALALFAAGRRFVSTTAGVVAALGFISTSWIAMAAMGGLIECAAAFYLLLAVYAVLLWTRRGDDQVDTDEAADLSDLSFEKLEHKRPEREKLAHGKILLAGYMAGSAVACKYPAVLFVVIPLGLWVVFDRWRFNWKPAIVFTIAVACGCGLWLAKNWALTGNPTYPLLYSVFGGETRTPEKDKQWRDGHGPGDLSLRSMRGKLYAFAMVHPFIVPLSALALYSRRHRRLVITLVILLGYSLAGWWFLTHQLERFLVPSSPLLALLVGIGASCMQAKPWRWILYGAVVVTSVGTFLEISVRRFDCDNRFLVSLSQLRRDKFHPADYGFSRTHPMHQYLNGIAEEVDGVLMVGDAQAFDLEVPVVYNTAFDDCIFETIMKGHSKDERLAELKARGISHVFVHWSEISRYREPGNYGFTDYVTPELIHDELVGQGMLRQIKLGIQHKTMDIVDLNNVPEAKLRMYKALSAEESGELFEVIWE